VWDVCSGGHEEALPAVCDEWEESEAVVVAALSCFELDSGPSVAFDSVIHMISIISLHAKRGVRGLA
jgi:hypothetical protein